MQQKIQTVIEVFIQFLIVFSLITFSLETLPNLTNYQLMLLRYIEIFIVSVFSIEYLIRIFISKPKLSYMFSFYGIVDLFAILPFYLSLGIDLRSIRILRMMRIFRVFKLGRYNKAIQTFYQAFVIAKEELFVYTVFTIILMFLSSVGIYYFENPAQPEVFKSIFHSLWWAVATFTTVGYGDIYPITIGGKIFTFVMLILGLGIVAVPTGIISSSLTKVKFEDTKLK